MPTSKENLTVYLPAEVKEELAKWAEAEKRSMSFLAEQIITDAINARKNSQQNTQDKDKA
jgi:predicted transcriptional regulator